MGQLKITQRHPTPPFLKNTSVSWVGFNINMKPQLYMPLPTATHVHNCLFSNLNTNTKYSGPPHLKQIENVENNIFDCLLLSSTDKIYSSAQLNKSWRMEKEPRFNQPPLKWTHISSPLALDVINIFFLPDSKVRDGPYSTIAVYKTWKTKKNIK